MRDLVNISAPSVNIFAIPQFFLKKRAVVSIGLPSGIYDTNNESYS
nr:MAG TPA: hypothetical protein [Caudoviricetes sp.]